MSANDQPRIALLIDADNAPAEMIDEILTELSTFGVINTRRAYGNWTKAGLQGWQNKLLQYAIRPMQQFDYSKGKNATDMAMTVDAMELLYTDEPDAYGIVSSDADFTPLVLHLRGKGTAVYGFGAAQTPQAFVNACSRFLYFDALVDRGDGITSRSDRREQAIAAAAALADVEIDLKTQVPGDLACGLRVPTHLLQQDRHLMSILHDAIKATQDETGWSRLAAMGTHIGNKLSFDARNYGYATLTKLLAATQMFELREEGTPRVSVREKPQP